MIPWIPYDKIPYSLKSDATSKAEATKLRSYEKMNWIVTEKVHGANFSISYDGFTFQFAKRSSLLSEDDSFFQYQRISDELKGNIQALWVLLTNESSATSSVTVYGELFGGIYPHEAVEKVMGLVPVQGGIFYSNNLHFIVFDIRVYNADRGNRYLSFHDMHRLCKQAGFLVTEPLFQGSRGKAMEFSTRFNSTIPDILKLPKLPHGNLCEGIVIRPEFDIDDDRIRLKIKNKEFSEIVDLDSESHSNIDVGWFMNRINQNRIDSAVSKMGIETDIDQLIDAVLDDLLVDVMSNDELLSKANDLLVIFQTNTDTLHDFVKCKFFPSETA